MSLNPFVCSPSATSGADAVRSSSASSLQRKKTFFLLLELQQRQIRRNSAVRKTWMTDGRFWNMNGNSILRHWMAAEHQKLRRASTHVYFFPANDKRTHYISTQSSWLLSTVKALMMCLPCMILSCVGRETSRTRNESCSRTQTLLFYTWIWAVLPCSEVILWCWYWSSHWWSLPFYFPPLPLIPLVSHLRTFSSVILTWNTLLKHSLYMF